MTRRAYEYANKQVQHAIHVQQKGYFHGNERGFFFWKLSDCTCWYLRASSRLLPHCKSQLALLICIQLASVIAANCCYPLQCMPILPLKKSDSEIVQVMAGDAVTIITRRTRRGESDSSRKES
jgi:hypothetical protein